MPKIHVHETTPGDQKIGLGEQRLAQLRADMRLTPEQRVKEAERTARLAQRNEPRRRIAKVIGFERYEDFLEYRERENIR